MIPTVLVPALILGRWWLAPIAAILWPFFVGDSCEDWACRASAAGLAALNALVGVALHQVVRRAVERGK